MTPRTFLFTSCVLAGLALAADTPVTPAPAAGKSAPATSSRPSRRERTTTETTTAAARTDPNSLDSFRVIADRNIFNPNRTGRRDREERAPRTDSISFVGTMDYEKGLLAFFDGTDSAYRKALRVGQSVGQFKITSIAADRVELDRDGQALTMGLAQQLRRPEGGDWTLVGADLVRSEQQAAAAADAAKNAAATANVIPANAPEALRRLMEARQKQLKQ
ncbi:MAG: hypothetical protein HZA93_13790 [Verrucomicrobia bacterium]|nr:hypothetical protein [Verrucomicrobiota bacterium]